MNKQYKIGDEVLVRGVVNSEVRNGGIHVLHDGVDAFYMLDQIHEPQKVVVPKFIADLIKELKLAEYTIGEIGACVYDYEEQKWIDDNEELFYRAFLDGYEIEQEKLYTVELFNGQPLVEVNNILHFSSDLAASNAHVSKDKLEKAGFGWVFDCSGVKVVEVE
ncbi:TPA: DUF1642 domain-containing protein [Streptococcus suis]|nr:DUF1642 domain-containing protein [Streptococcus suis]HEM5142976.1 DUF1642 domain-containing protein [Streptococcus suis]HEM5151153.1 DUF1642 domain-containing protein [Streptococcus suis]